MCTCDFDDHTQLLLGIWHRSLRVDPNAFEKQSKVWQKRYVAPILLPQGSYMEVAWEQ